MKRTNKQIEWADNIIGDNIRFLVSRSIDDMREICGDASAKLIESCVDVSEGAKNG